ncbi:ABC transporter ATP-binding protein [Vibrio sp. MA40-2]|uniref:ABC transporter ATP-binding protein n=1 Tax=Vibrio sp. MA40-2 TaxID=3391828 RepID=UPI0039A43EC4
MSKITVSNIEKSYKQYPNRFSRLIEWMSLGRKVCHTLIPVLKGVTFDVESADSVAILGVNGAGKSTLLKIITGTSAPTHGQVKIEGSVSALLELGMGFHPDFSGRQNVYMAGQLLGLNSQDISNMMESIIAFSEVGEYIDKPVRVYSSGMQVRLAFAVATARRPDVLIVDEALSVGDVAFQRKCFQRIEDFRQKGTTLLFVTHDIETVKRICNKAILIKNGEIFAMGKAKEVCNIYEKEQSVVSNIEKVPALDKGEETNYGTFKTIIKNISINEMIDQKIFHVSNNNDLRFVFYIEIKSDLNSLCFSMMLKTKDGISVYGIDTSNVEIFNVNSFERGCYKIKISIENKFSPGTYYLNCGIREHSDSDEYLHRRLDCGILNIIEESDVFVKHGLINARFESNIMRVDDEG